MASTTSIDSRFSWDVGLVLLYRGAQEEDKEKDEPANVDAAKILLIVLSFQRVWRGELIDNQISNTALITLKAVSSSLTGSLL